MTTLTVVKTGSARGGPGRPDPGADRSAGSRLGSHLTDVEELLALAADDDRVHVVVASGVVQHQWCPLPGP